MEPGERGVHGGRGRGLSGGVGDEFRGDQGAGDRCGFEEGEELEDGAGEGVAVAVELVEGEVPGVPDDAARGVRVSRCSGVFGSQEVGELGFEGVLVGGEGAVPAGGDRQVGACRVQREREPAEPDGQRFGLALGSGVRCGVQENNSARVVGEGLEVDQAGVRSPGLRARVPARDQQNPAAVRPQPAPVGGRRSCTGPDAGRRVDVVDHDQPSLDGGQVLPDGVDEGYPACAGFLQPGLGKPEDVRGLREVLSELLGVIAPPDPYHHLPLGPGLRGGLGGERGLSQTAGSADHGHAPARPPHQGADPLQLCLASPHRCRDRWRVHRVPAGGDPPERHGPYATVRCPGGQAPLPEEQPERHHGQPCEDRPHQGGVLRPFRRLRGDVVRHDRHEESDRRRTPRHRGTHPGRTPVTRHPTPPAPPGTPDHIIAPAPPRVCDPSGPVPARDTTSVVQRGGSGEQGSEAGMRYLLRALRPRAASAPSAPGPLPPSPPRCRPPGPCCAPYG